MTVIQTNGLSVDDTQKNQRASTDQAEFQKNGWAKFVGSGCFQNQVQPPQALLVAECLLLKSSRLSSATPLQFGCFESFSQFVTEFGELHLYL